MADVCWDRNLVITSVTLKYHDFEKTVTSQSWVHFDQLSDEEIHAYLATGDYKDKSGAYGIQSLAGQYIQKLMVVLCNYGITA